jgi:hypothetical protein
MTEDDAVRLLRARNVSIYRLRRRGVSLRAIGDLYGMTGSNAARLVAKAERVQWWAAVRARQGERFVYCAGPQERIKARIMFGADKPRPDKPPRVSHKELRLAKRELGTHLGELRVHALENVRNEAIALRQFVEDGGELSPEMVTRAVARACAMAIVSAWGLPARKVKRAGLAI